MRILYSCAFAYAFSLPMWAEKPMLETEIAEQSKGISIKGTVLDESGLPVIGANIMVKGTNTGTITDLNGYFSLSVPYADAVLTVSFIGYTSQDVPLKGRKEVKVVLVEDSKTLQEVVVVGFGSQKKATLTGAVASVNVKELSQSPSANITNALADVCRDLPLLSLAVVSRVRTWLHLLSGVCLPITEERSLRLSLWME